MEAARAHDGFVEDGCRNPDPEGKEDFEAAEEEEI